jgi:hypothetical protein
VQWGPLGLAWQARVATWVFFAETVGSPGPYHITTGRATLTLQAPAQEAVHVLAAHGSRSPWVSPGRVGPRQAKPRGIVLTGPGQATSALCALGQEEIRPSGLRIQINPFPFLFWFKFMFKL